MSDTNEAREREKEELERKEAATKQKIMELHTVNGRLQLELKCVQQEVELYDYRLLAERNKVERLQVWLHAAHTNEALLRSTVDSTVSMSALPHSSEGAAEVLPTIDESRSSDVVSTQSITHAPSGGQSAATLSSTVHTSRVPPLSKFSGSNDNETFMELHEQFEPVTTVCGWNSQSKLAHLATD